MATTKKAPAQAHYASKDITPVMRDFIEYIERETGYKVDPMSVQLSSLLRGSFQKSPANQKRIAAQKANAAKEPVRRLAKPAAKAGK